MPLISVENLTKYYGTELILDHVSFAIDHRERLGFIGANGTGKTTLCRILLGQEQYEDDSRIHIARGTTIGYLSQDVRFHGAATPWELVMSLFKDLKRREKRMHEVTERMGAQGVDDDELHRLLDEHARLLEEFERHGGYDYEHRAAGVLTRVGVPEVDFHRPLSSFSGGEQRRAALAKLLLEAPDLLLLDEPTNHLDVQGIEWLEQYLRNYPGAVVAISHDRRFLDSVAQKILELEACDLTEYRGGYSDYMRQKEQRLMVYERQYEKQQQELKKQMSFIRWALATQQEKRVKAAKSRLKLLEKTEYLDPPLNQRRKMSIRFQPRVRGGNEILLLEGLGKQFGGKRLFSGLDLLVRRGERVGVVGANGTGKTTLLKIALGVETPSEGTAQLGKSVEVGYHRQEEFGLDPNNTVLQEFATAVPDADTAELRSLLARFLFVEDDVYARLFDYAHSLGCKVLVHSCGYVEPLVPGMIEAGMDCLQAMEVKAGMDLPTLFGRFGDKISFYGGVDVRCLISNDFKQIDEEMDRKILPVINGGGGYILHSDHSEPPDVNYETMKYFVERGRTLGR